MLCAFSRWFPVSLSIIKNGGGSIFRNTTSMNSWPLFATTTPAKLPEPRSTTIGEH
jgi:hypothetical protein